MFWGGGGGDGRRVVALVILDGRGGWGLWFVFFSKFIDFILGYIFIWGFERG